jgi:hypothetical protein
MDALYDHVFKTPNALAAETATRLAVEKMTDAEYKATYFTYTFTEAYYDSKCVRVSHSKS